MNREELLQRADHTLLAQTAVWGQIKEICEDALQFHTASVCIPPSFVKQVSQAFGGQLAICTVIGFPNGYQTTAVKVYETQDAVSNGADEMDMVVNIGWIKEGRYDKIKEEIQAVRAACRGKILKVIIETCLLTQEEKIAMCQTVSQTDADYIKTSTGFSTGGATFADVELMRRHTAPQKKVKAAGGISSFADAQRFVELGADRLGTSRLVREMKQA